MYSPLINLKDDTVQTDLLIGADYYDAIVSPHHMPKQVLGMWLRRTIYGQYILQGKIPGSSASVKDNLNTLNITIHHVANCPFLPILDNDETVDVHNAKDIVRELNEYDALGIRMENRDDEDKEAENVFKSNMQIDKVSGKYIVGFPWVNNIAPSQLDLDSNYDIAKARFISTCKSLGKYPVKMLKYKQVHD